VGPRAGLDSVVKRKIPSPCRESNPAIIQPVAQRYTTELYRLLVHFNVNEIIKFQMRFKKLSNVLFCLSVRPSIRSEVTASKLLGAQLNETRSGRSVLNSVGTFRFTYICYFKATCLIGLNELLHISFEY
jgi:hypothetical protein